MVPIGGFDPQSRHLNDPGETRRVLNCLHHNHHNHNNYHYHHQTGLRCFLVTSFVRTLSGWPAMSNAMRAAAQAVRTTSTFLGLRLSVVLRASFGTVSGEGFSSVPSRSSVAAKSIS